MDDPFLRSACGVLASFSLLLAPMWKAVAAAPRLKTSAPGTTAIPAYGHSPGHSIYAVDSRASDGCCGAI